MAQDWKPVTGNIMTPWAAEVTPDNVWKEYPRPQMERKEWLNLNGLWDFSIVLGTENTPGRRLDRKILVPFCVESALSGIKETVTGSQEMVYRRTFRVPESWKGKRILLNFQASDYRTKVWVNGKFIGEHLGGYDAFQFDITDALGSTPDQEISLVIWDPSNTGTQTIGKQTLYGLSKGRYTPTSGVYQTVWLEPVSDVSIKRLKILPDVDQSTLTVETSLKGWSYDNTVKVQAFDKGTLVASGEGIPGKPVVLKLTSPKLWSPDSPNLYDLKVSLARGNDVVDEVSSYFGMRKISTGRDAAGFMRIRLNNKEIFQFGPLDQGYWPDGLLTPASDEALKYDVEYLKKIGCNMDRVHIKVQPERFYYWCDKLGILVWQDMISPNSNQNRSQTGGGKVWEAEWEKIIDQLYNYPSIVQWTVFNESWGQFDTERITDWTKAKDPSRLVTPASGWVDRPVGDIRDFHDYTVYPSMGWIQKNYPRAMVLGEGGGHELIVRDHLWNPDIKIDERVDRAGDLIREVVNTKEDLDERYSLWVENLWYLKKYGLNAVVYTQISDVENELNGWMTYDRKLSKLPVERFAELHNKLYTPAPANGKFVIPLSMKTPQKWFYAFEQQASDWYKAEKGKWNSGNGPFGKALLNVPDVNTTWSTGTLFIQKDFNLSSVPKRLALVGYHHGLADIYINGVFAIQVNNLRRWDPEIKVSEVPLPEKAMKLLKKGTNNIAIKYEFGSIAQGSVFSTQAPTSNFFDIGVIAY
jgi:hypothetical protein